MTLRASFGLVLSFSAACAIDQGAIRIEDDGKMLDLHVVALSEKGTLFSTSEKSITLKWGNQTRGFLARHESDEMTVANYYNVTLLNRELSYDVDLSSVGCSCNAALFFASMPGHSPDGSVAPGDFNPYYCDANKVGGVWCWEHDTIEANRYTIQTAPHKCSAQPGEYISSCDRAGCGTNAFNMDPYGMCPSEDCEIDTRRPFRIHQRFEANHEGKLVRIVNRFAQEGNIFSWEACPDAPYLAQMSQAFSSNMTMVFQLWGDSEKNMDWLDGMTGCEGACVAEDTEVTFSNIAFRSLAPVPGDELIIM